MNSANTPANVPANTTGSGNEALCYGSLDNPHTLQVFVEMRDPGSAKMAGTLLGPIRRAADQGKLVVAFHFNASLDDEVGGGGSRSALSALAAASDVGQGQFIEYLAALFAAEPQFVTDDPFADPAFLLDRAGSVPGLRSPGFDRKVSQNTYASWAANAVADFQDSGVVGTPTIWFDQRVLLGIPAGTGLSPEAFLAGIQR